MDRPLDRIIRDDASAAGPGHSTPPDRRWIGVYFDCCGVYARIYRAENQTAYLGSCPRCRRTLRIPVGPNGTLQRIFRAK